MTSHIGISTYQDINQYIDRWGCSEISTYQDINVGDQEINLDLDQEIVLKKGLMLTNSPSGIYWEIVTIKLDTTVESSRLSY